MRSNLKTLAFGGALLTIGSIAGKAAELITRIVFARSFDQAEYGTFIILVSILGIGTLIGGFGITTGIPKKIAEQSHQKIRRVFAGLALSTTLIGSIMLSLLLLLSSNWVAEYFGLSSPDLVIWVAVSLPFLVLIRLFSSLFIGYKESTPRVVINELVLKGGRLGLVLILILLGVSFRGVVLGYLVFVVPVFIGYFYLVNRKLKPIFTTTNRFKEMMVFALPIYVGTFFDKITEWADTLILGSMLSLEAVANYNAAHPLAQLASILFSSVGVIFMPIIAASKTKEESSFILAVTTKWLVLFSFPLACALLLTPELVLSIFGKEYLGNEWLLRCLSLAYLANLGFGFNGISLIGHGSTKTVMRSSLVAGILNILLNLVLIPMWGLFGAATALLLSVLTRNLLNSVALYRRHQVHPYNRKFVMLIGLSVVLVSVSFLLDRYLDFDGYMEGGAQILMTTLILFGSYFGFRMYDEEEMDLLKKVRAKIRG